MGLRWLFPLFLFILCLSFLWWYTLGFSAFTVFSYTLKRAGELPYPVPPLEVECHNGKRINLSSERGTFMVNFIYLNCLYGCPISLAKMFQLRKASPDLTFVSISVDPERDRIEDLRERWRAMDAFDNWYFCRPVGREWKKKLELLGVWVYRREDGLINHTLDLFFIKNGRVIKTFPPEYRVEEIFKEVKG